MEESSALWQSSGGSSILRPANRFVPLIHAKRAIGYKGEGFSYTARARRRALTYHLDVIIWQYCISGDSRVGDFLSGTPGNNHTLSRSHSRHSIRTSTTYGNLMILKLGLTCFSRTMRNTDDVQSSLPVGNVVLNAENAFQE